MGQEYELEKKLTPPNPEGRNQYSEVKGHSDPQPKTTAEKIADEHGISEKTVKRSADLYRSHQTVKEIAPEVAQKCESGEIKVPGRDLRVVGRALQKGTPEQKEQIASEVKSDFKKAVETAKEITVPHAIEPEIPVTPLIQLAEEPRPDSVEAVREWAEDLKAKQDMPAIPRYITDLLDLKSIKSMSEYLLCPCCGRPVYAGRAG